MTALARGTIPKGFQLNGIYEIDEPLASGGMGEVYRAHAIETGDPVAIKLIRADLAEDEAVLTLFRREASALHAIYHEAIVRYYVFSIDPVLRRPYLAMEFVVGEPLSDVLKAGRLSLSDVMALKRRIGSGLFAAHEAGIVHRDVAPDNILVSGRNFAKARIIDFGIARTSRPGESTVIGSGFAGKYNYVSPEQLGLFNGEVSARSDIYSFGLVLAYACLGQRLDMGGSQLEVIEKRRHVPDLSGVYPEIRPLLTLMLQPDPGLRPASMREVADWTPDLASPAGERTILAPVTAKSSATAPARPLPAEARPEAAAASDRGSRGRRFALGAAALAVALVAGVGLYYALKEPSRPVRPSQEETAPGQTPPAPLPPLEKAALMRDFVAKYDAGGCVLLKPVELTGAVARFDGIGLDSAPFEKFDRAFRAASGVEPDISLRRIVAAQCPAVDFLARVDAGGKMPKLSLRAASIRNGDILSGTVTGDSPNLDLLVVDDDGRVYNVSAQIRPDNAFAMQLRKAGGAKVHPMLILALASPTPLEKLKSAKGADGQNFFRDLTEEAAGLAGLRANALYFEIE